MKQYAYLSPARVTCPTCDAPPDEGCRTWQPRYDTWISNPNYHVEREQAFRCTDLPLQMTLPVDGFTL